MEEAWAVPMVVVMDLVVEVVDMAAEGSKNSEEKGYSSWQEREQGVVRKAAGYFETVIPNALEEL